MVTEAPSHSSAGPIGNDGAGVVTLGMLRIDVQNRQLWRDNTALHLTPTEWSVLLALLRHRGSLVTHDMLLHQVWGNAHGANADYVHVYMNRLRRKLEADPTNPHLLVTEPGSGYRLLMPAIGAPARPLEHTRSVLPPQLTSFVGREADLQAVAALLARSDVRLVSLTGTGGVGKTRLAVEVAARLASQWRHGVVFVDLAPINDRDLILPAIARTLGMEGQSEQELAVSLRTTLHEQQMVLLLDNVEHLPVAALVADLLAWAPELTVLVTSRVRLGMQGEHAYMVRPLAPSSAVTLFVARAEAVSADFELTAENASAISAICTLLDGLPLAIELAAARSAVLPPETLLTRLLPENTSDTDYLKMLRGSQDRPVRQQTLRNTIDWSYDLLDPAARTLFTHLSVFAGGCTLEAIEAICLPPGPASSHVSPDYLLDHLTMLVDHHLVQRSTTTHPPRFSLLETMRAYAHERLVACDEAEVMQECHATFYRMLALAAEPHLQGRDQLLWLDQVEHERANLRAATRWLLDHGRSAEAVTVVAALDAFWILRGGASEAEQWLRTALAAALPPIPKAAAMTILGLLRMLQHDHDQATALFTESLRIWRAANDGRWIAATLNHWATSYQARGKHSEALPLLKESLSRFQSRHDDVGVACVQSKLSWSLIETGSVEHGLALAEDTIRLLRTTGDRMDMAALLHLVGRLLVARGETARGLAHLHQGLALYEELGYKQGAIAVWWSLAGIALDGADPAGAHRYLLAGLEACRSTREWSMATRYVARLAVLAGRTQQPIHASHLCGATAAIQARYGTSLPPDQESEYDQVCAAAHAALPPATWVAAWSAGYAFDTEQVLEYATSISAAVP